MRYKESVPFKAMNVLMVRMDYDDGIICGTMYGVVGR